jgi:hypothetical protein
VSIHRGKMRKCVQCGKKFRAIAEVKLHQRGSLREERGLFEAVYDNEAYLHLRAGREWLAQAARGALRDRGRYSQNSPKDSIS